MPFTFTSLWTNKTKVERITDNDSHITEHLVPVMCCTLQQVLLLQAKHGHLSQLFSEDLQCESCLNPPSLLLEINEKCSYV